MMGARVAEPGLMEEAVKYASAGGGAMGVLLLTAATVRWFITWLTGRHDRREDRLAAEDREIDQKWKAYRETLENDRREMREEIAHLRVGLANIQVEVERCHAEKREMADRLSRLEGFSTGRGEARQLGQIEQSARRVIDGEEAG